MGTAQQDRARRGGAAPVQIRRSGPASTYRDLVGRGFALNEAANLTAYLHGLPLATQAWTPEQVKALLFLRSLRENGRFGPADEAVRRAG